MGTSVGVGVTGLIGERVTGKWEMHGRMGDTKWLMINGYVGGRGGTGDRSYGTRGAGGLRVTGTTFDEGKSDVLPPLPPTATTSAQECH